MKKVFSWRSFLASWRRGGCIGISMYVGIGSAIIFGAVLRFARLGAPSFWFDEGYTEWIIRYRPGEIVRLIGADTSPPLYYILLHLWSGVLGNSETALRGFSASLGVASIALVGGVAYRILKRPTAAVAAAWLFVLSFPQVWYSQEARGYELGAFMTALLVYILVGYLERARGWVLVSLIAVGGTAIYVNNFLPFYLVAIALAGLMLPSAAAMKRRIRMGLIVGGALALIYLPWASSLMSQIHRVNQGFWIGRPTVDSLCEKLAWVFGVAHFWSWDRFVYRAFRDVGIGIVRTAGILIFCGVAGIVILLRGKNRRAALAVGTVAILPPILMAIYSCFGQSIFMNSAMLPSTVVTPILMAGPLAWASTWMGRQMARVMVLGAFVLCFINLWAFEKERSKEDWRGAAAMVAAMPSAPHRLIVFVANEGQLPFDYYYRLRPGEVETGAPAGFFDIDPPRTQRRVMSADDLATLRERIIHGNFDDVVLVDSHAGWEDKNGIVHEGYSDPNALTVKMILGLKTTVERMDLPADAGHHAITVWRVK